MAEPGPSSLSAPPPPHTGPQVIKFLSPSPPPVSSPPRPKRAKAGAHPATFDSAPTEGLSSVEAALVKHILDSLKEEATVNHIMNQAGWRNMSVEKDRVTRPRNPYILFRTIYVKNLQTLYPKEYNRFDQKEGSRDIGRIWRSLSDSEQKPFNDLAEREKQEHKAFHPTYRWADRFKNAKPSKKRQLAEREREGGEKPHLMLRGPDPDELAKRQAWANGLEYSPNWFDGRSSRPPQSLPRHDDKTPNWVQLEACGRKESFGGGDSCVKSTEGKVRVIVANYDAEKSKERKTSTSSVIDDDVQMGDTSTPQKEKHVTVEVEMEDATSSRSSSGSIPPNPLKRPRSVTPDGETPSDARPPPQPPTPPSPRPFLLRPVSPAERKPPRDHPHHPNHAHGAENIDCANHETRGIGSLHPYRQSIEIEGSGGNLYGGGNAQWGGWKSWGVVHRVYEPWTKDKQMIEREREKRGPSPPLSAASTMPSPAPTTRTASTSASTTPNPPHPLQQAETSAQYQESTTFVFTPQSALNPGGPPVEVKGEVIIEEGKAYDYAETRKRITQDERKAGVARKGGPGRGKKGPMSQGQGETSAIAMHDNSREVEDDFDDEDDAEDDLDGAGKDIESEDED